MAASIDNLSRRPQILTSMFNRLVIWLNSFEGFIFPFQLARIELLVQPNGMKGGAVAFKPGFLLAHIGA
ncbi:MAG: hypothetical protein L3J32_11620, partial [Rhizobiaceae bacterium]|nr:hypothetical protein [Rhizobiaceae bacterium]